MARAAAAGYLRRMERATAAAEAPAQAEPQAAAPALVATLPGHILALQRSAGNRATVRALARAPLDTVPATARTRLREVTDALPTINVTALHSRPARPAGPCAARSRPPPSTEQASPPPSSRC